jgi:hypothetical protein
LDQFGAVVFPWKGWWYQTGQVITIVEATGRNQLTFQEHEGGLLDTGHGLANAPNRNVSAPANRHDGHMVMADEAVSHGFSTEGLQV